LSFSSVCRGTSGDHKNWPGRPPPPPVPFLWPPICPLPPNPEISTDYAPNVAPAPIRPPPPFCFPPAPPRPLCHAPYCPGLPGGNSGFGPTPPIQGGQKRSRKIFGFAGAPGVFGEIWAAPVQAGPEQQPNVFPPPLENHFTTVGMGCVWAARPWDLGFLLGKSPPPPNPPPAPDSIPPPPQAPLPRRGTTRGFFNAFFF